MFVYREFYFKSLAYAFMEAGKFKICRVAWRPGEELLSQLSAKSVRWQNSHRGGPDFFSEDFQLIR